MSDIDSQTFSGAVATSTHGTGRELQSISGQMLSSRFVTANGDVVNCSPTENSDLYYASGNHLGALGVMTRSRIQTESAYHLKEHSWMMSEEEGRSEERRVGKECRTRRGREVSSRRRHTRCGRDWRSDVCSSDLSSRFVTANGDVVNCSPTENSDLYYASGNHLGALGVMTRSRIQTESAYHLKEHSWMMSEEEGIETAAELSKQHRHYEMFALPHSDYILGLTLDQVSEDEIPESQDENVGDAYEAFRMLSNVIDYMPFARRWLVNYGAGTVKPETRYGTSPEIFGNLR